MKKYFFILLALGLIVVAFVGALFYSQNLLFLAKNPKNDSSEPPFFLAAESQVNLYPLRDWKVNEPKLNAEIAFLSDIDSNFTFFQKNPNLRRPIASITKLMTAFVAKKYLPNQTAITINERIFGFDGINNVLKPGEVLTVEDLLKILLLVSSNNAANALADGFGQEQFIKLMNEEAKNMNLTQTTFRDPSGLSLGNQSTAEDLKRLTQHILKEEPETFAITQEDEASVTSEDKKFIHSLKNINLLAHSPKFLEELNIKYLGGKTGFTDEAKETFLGLFSVPSQKFSGQYRRVLVVVLNSASRYNDIESLLRWLKTAYVF